MTAPFAMNELLDKTGGSIYKLVVLAAKRAVELNAGMHRLIEENPGKAGSIALEEIRQGKVRIKISG